MPVYHFTSTMDKWKQSKTKTKITPSKLNKISTGNRNQLEKMPYFLWTIWNNETIWRAFSSNNVYKPSQSILNECMKSTAFQVIKSTISSHQELVLLKHNPKTSIRNWVLSLRSLNKLMEVLQSPLSPHFPLWLLISASLKKINKNQPVDKFHG